MRRVAAGAVSTSPGFGNKRSSSRSPIRDGWQDVDIPDNGDAIRASRVLPRPASAASLRHVRASPKPVPSEAFVRRALEAGRRIALVQALLTASQPTARVAITSASRRCSVVDQTTDFAGTSSSALIASTCQPSLNREGLHSLQKGLFCRYLSPLPDSNRRPPPYHALRSATGRNPRQRFRLV